MEGASEIGEFEAQGAASPPPASGTSSPTDAAAASGFRLSGTKRGRVPASSEAIQGLREVAPPTDGSDCFCAICLEDFDADARLRAMPCSHAFHEGCIFQWLRRSAACPLCRRQHLPDEEGQVRMSRWVRYDEDGQPYMHFSSRDPLPDDDDEEPELNEEQQRREAMLREQLARWHNLLEHRARSQSSS